MTWLWPTILTAIVVPLFLTRYEPPPELGAVVAVRYLLMALALFLVSLVGLRSPLTVEISYLGLGASVVFLAGLVVVLVDAV